MVDFVETATLRVNDQSTRKLRLIRREVRNLRREAQGLRNIRLRFDGLSRATKQARDLNAALRALPRSKTVRVNAAIQNLNGARTSLNTLARTREARINVVVAGAGAARTTLNRLGAAAFAPVVPPVGPRGPVQPRVPTTGQSARGNQFLNGFAGAFRDQLQPERMGQVMARGFTYSIQNELFQVMRRVVGAAASAPVDLDSARARVRIAGRSEEELVIAERLADALNNEFQTVSTAEILANSGEVLGRVGSLLDPTNFEAASIAMRRLTESTQILRSALPAERRADAPNQARLVEAAIQQVGATEDPEFAALIRNAVLQASIASGGDLTPADVKRALQQLPDARAGIGANTLLTMLLGRDEQGRRGTGNLNQMFSDLLRGNLNEADLETQLAQGLRNADGTSDAFAALQNDVLQGVQDEIIPRLQALGVETDFSNLTRGTEEFSEATARLRAALDNELGFSKQGGISALTELITNLDQNLAERNRAQQTDLDFAANNLTVRQELNAVDAQFRDVAAQALDPLVPIMKTSLDAISDTFSAISSGDGASAAQITTAGIAALPLAIGAGLEASLNSETRSLGLAGVALAGSAGALSGAAAALTGAAAAQGATAAAGGGRRGLLGRAGAFALGALRNPYLLAAGAGAIGGRELSNFTFEAGGGAEQARADHAERLASDAMLAEELIRTGQIVRHLDGTYRNAEGTFGQTITRGMVEHLESRAADGRGVTALEGPEAGAAIPRALDTAGNLAVALESDRNTALALFGEESSQLEQALNTQGPVIGAQPEEFLTAAEQAGPLIGAALLAVAPQIGATIGQTASALIGNNAQSAPAPSLGETVLE